MSSTSPTSPGAARDREAWPLGQVTLVGVGLLGGSLGLALRQRGLARRVVGLGRDATRLHEARTMGCIDDALTDARAALAHADLVVLCQPVRTIIQFFPACFEHIPPGAVVTDVGSTKESVVAAGEQAARQRGEGTAFVGSHPMAGSERSGSRHARPDLYEEATCHVAVTEQSPPHAVALVADMWRRLGMRVILTHPARHDHMVAAFSHIPHMVALALMEAIERVDGHPQFLHRLAGPGFRDMTRVAMGSPEMWMDIVRENRPAIAEGLRDLAARLDRWAGRIEQSDDAGIERHMNALRDSRRGFQPTGPQPESPTE